MLTWSRLRALYQSGVLGQVRKYRGWKRADALSENEYPKITVPQSMMENLQKQKVRDALVKAQAERPKLKSLVLSSKNKVYNHYKGQKFDEFDTKRLASHGWKHRRCGPDFFTLVPRGQNPSVYREDEIVQTFEEMGLDARINTFLQEQGITKPTKIQSQVIPVMLKGQHVLCAAETGSGKTYAYLLPLVHMLLNHEKTSDSDDKKPNAPFAIIVSPSRELVTQITHVCSVMAESVSFIPATLSKMQLKKKQPMDIVISTAGTLEIMINTGRLSLSRMHTIILDEADTLLDDSFIEETLAVLEKLQVGSITGTEEDDSSSNSVQVGLVSATYPRNLDDNIGQIMPLESFTMLRTKQLHCVMPHVQQNFLRMRSQYKLENIVRILKKRGSHMYMVFCNKFDTCYWLSKSLKEADIDSVVIASILKPKARAQLLEAYFDGQCDVLICTDIASRGLDTHMVDHVINFDCPKFISDYIHRVGRVGRVSSKYSGQVTSFVTHSSDIELVWKIEMAARQDKELHNVNANVKRVLKGRAERAGHNVEEEDDEEEGRAVQRGQRRAGQRGQGRAERARHTVDMEDDEEDDHS